MGRRVAVILVVGALANPTVARVCRELERRGHPFWLLDSRGYGSDFQLSWCLDRGCLDGGRLDRGRLDRGRLDRGRLDRGRLSGWVESAGRRLDLDRVRSIYVHQVDPPHAATTYESFARRAAFDAFLNAFPRPVLSRPIASAANAVKLYQQRSIERAGFRVPQSIVTTDPDQARRFVQAVGGPVLSKPCSHRRAQARILEPEDLEHLEQVRHCPTLLQEFIAGVEVRVHTVEDRLFATEILAATVDYRYPSGRGECARLRPIELPEPLRERCLTLAKSLGIIVSGIDLRRTDINLHAGRSQHAGRKHPAGGKPHVGEKEYVALEVNPAPGFAWYEEQTGQRITAAVVDFLTSDVR